MSPETEEMVHEHCNFNRISNERRRLMLRVMRTYEDGYGPFREIDAVKFEAFLSDLMAQAAHVNTVRQLGNVLRVFVKRGWQRGTIAADTYMRIRAVEDPRGATARTTPNPYTREQIERLFALIDERWTVPSRITVERWLRGAAGYGKVYPLFANRQTKAIVALALDCGMRRNEIYRATVQDIHADNEYVVVRMGKAEIDGEPRYREVPWTDYANRKVGDWLTVRKWLKPTHESPWLVLSPRANLNSWLPSLPEQPMRKDAFGHLLGDLGEKGEYGLHRLRHTCATFKLRSGMPIEVLSRFLGHSSIQQTLCYAKLDRTDLQRASERTEDAFDLLMGERT